MVVSVEKLYSNYDLLSKGSGEPAKMEAAFKEILEAVKGDTKTKQLACQFIVKFYKKFPNLEGDAIDAQLDLCEDEDQSIRRYAIKELPNFCKENPENVSKIADILSQLLATDDPVEMVVVQGSLYQLLKTNPKECLLGVFQQIENPDADDSTLREKTCKFVAAKLATIAEDLSAEAEKFIVETVKKLMIKADPGTFAGLLSILAVMKSMKLLTVRQQMVELIEAKAGTKLSASEFDNRKIRFFYQCCEQALPFFSKNVSSHKFVVCLCEKVLPSAMTKIAVSGDGQKGLPSKSQLLKLLAELSSNASSDQVTLVTIQHLFQVLLDLMPTPPESLASGDEAFKDFADLDLCSVECAIYAFHSLSASHNEFFTAPEAQSRMTDFRKRLQYFALGLQSYSKKLNEALKVKADADSVEMKTKKEALAACSNISTIIKDLFRMPPQHTASITLSWKTSAVPVKETVAKSPVKRHAPITGPGGSENSNGVAAKAPRQLYRAREGWGRGRGAGGGSRGGRGFYRGGRF